MDDHASRERRWSVAAIAAVIAVAPVLASTPGTKG
jgi:hypothetical protein